MNVFPSSPPFCHHFFSGGVSPQRRGAARSRAVHFLAAWMSLLQTPTWAAFHPAGILLQSSLTKMFFHSGISSGGAPTKHVSCSPSLVDQESTLGSTQRSLTSVCHLLRNPSCRSVIPVTHEYTTRSNFGTFFKLLHT